MCDAEGIDQPEWQLLQSADDAFAFCERVGYPCLVRPSYVLSGAAMNVAYSRDELGAYLTEVRGRVSIIYVSTLCPRFFANASLQ